MPFWSVVTLLCGCAILTVIIYVVLAKLHIVWRKGMLSAINQYQLENKTKWCWLWDGSLIRNENSVVEFDGIIITNAGIVIINRLETSKKRHTDLEVWEMIANANHELSIIIAKILNVSFPVTSIVYYKKRLMQFDGELQRIENYEAIFEAIQKKDGSSKVFLTIKERNAIFELLNLEVKKAIDVQVQIHKYKYLRKRSFSGIK